MNDLKIGDKVIFNFNDGAITYDHTRRLTIRYLVEGCIYTIIDLQEYSIWELHLKLKEESTHGYWYPSSCFKCVDFKTRYELR